MTSVEKLVSNGNSIINFLHEFSDENPMDINVDWVNSDGTITTKSFMNIRKFQEDVGMHNDNGTIKDTDGNRIINTGLIASENNDNKLTTDTGVPARIVSVEFTAVIDNPTLFVTANTVHACENSTDDDGGNTNVAAGVGYKIGVASDSPADYLPVHGDDDSRENIESIGEFYVQDALLEYNGNDGTFLYEMKPVTYTGAVQTTCAKGDILTVALFVQSGTELSWGAAKGKHALDGYRNNITVMQG